LAGGQWQSLEGAAPGPPAAWSGAWIRLAGHRTRLPRPESRWRLTGRGALRQAGLGVGPQQGEVPAADEPLAMGVTAIGSPTPHEQGAARSFSNLRRCGMRRLAGHARKLCVRSGERLPIKLVVVGGSSRGGCASRNGLGSSEAIRDTGRPTSRCRPYRRALRQRLVVRRIIESGALLGVDK